MSRNRRRVTRMTNPESFKLPSIEQGSFSYTHRSKQHGGCPRFVVGTWVLGLGLLGVPQVRCWNLGLEVAWGRCPLTLPRRLTGNFRPLTPQNNTEGAWGCLGLPCPLTLPRRLIGSFRPLTAPDNTEGAPGSLLEPGSWGCLGLPCPLTLPRQSPPAPPFFLGKTPNCSTANLSDVSPVRESPDSRACNSTFPSSSLGCTH